MEFQNFSPAAGIGIDGNSFRFLNSTVLQRSPMAAARQTRTSWNKLIDNSDQPIWVVDAEWRIVLANPALRAWWGEGGEQLEGQEIRFSSPLAPDPRVFNGRAGQSISEHPLEPTRRLAVQWVSFLTADGKVQAAGAWGTRAESTDQGSSYQTSSLRITTSTDWHTLLAEHRARTRGPANLGRFVGESLGMQSLRTRAALAARHTEPVWICGPAGSGRRTLARTIQARTSGDDAAQVEWDAAQLTPELLQRQIADFLSNQNASLAKNPSPPRGAVLLFHAEKLALSSLRDLQSLQARTPIRLLLTTDQAPEKLLRNSHWPAELLAHWSALTLEIPPLAARLADLPLVVQQLIAECNLAEQKQRRGCSLAALELLAAYRWPGDVAELARVIRAAHQAADGIEIQPADLPSWLRQAESALSSPRPVPLAFDLDQQLVEIEREMLSRALRLADGNKTQASKLVGWTRQRFLRRTEELGLVTNAATKSTPQEPEFIPDLPFEPEE